MDGLPRIICSPNLQAKYTASTGHNLLHSHVLAEIIIRSAVAFEAPAYALGLESAGNDPGQEALLCGPAGLGLRLAVAARHGVIEPAVWCARVEVNVVALAVGFESVPKTLHVFDRDDVISLAESREDRTGERCNHLIQRLWLELVHLPLPLGGGAVPHDGGADRHLGGENERMPPRLTIAGDDDLAQVCGRLLRQERERGLDQFDGLGIGEVIPRVARVEGSLIRMTEKEIGRQHRISVARAAYRLVARVFH